LSQANIRIKTGTYRNFDCAGRVFELVKQFTPGTNGGFVTVRNGDTFPNFPKIIRVNIKHFTDYEFVGTDTAATVSEAVAEAQAILQTDEERIAEIAKRFEILNDMSKACICGDIRAMIISGPPGVGKSFIVEREVEKAQLLDQIAGTRLRAEVVKGSATPIGLYQTLYKYSDKNCVLVFDDCDSILLDDVALNLLKGALDSGKKRKISWLAESSALRREGIPDKFEFKGSVIFITNLKFDAVRSQKLRDHLDALQSRCHYLDLTLDTMRDKLLRIRQIAGTGDLFGDYEFEQGEDQEIIEFMEHNQNHLREMSLRMATKIADLRKSFPTKWQSLAQSTCMKAA
jgi:hypothetical protein